MKRRLRPARPILLPIWTALLAVAERIKRALEGTMPRGGIRPLTEPEFEEMVARFPYYGGRWGYMSAALSQAETLIRRRRARTALELGVPVRPIIVGADAMDITARPELDPAVRMTLHDATETPWPIGDKGYDIFMALQVFEHLGDGQRNAFLEVRRIARHAIISLPIEWVMDDPMDKHHGITNERALSWFAPVVPSRIVEGSPGKRRRVIYVFEDLPA